MSKWTSVLFNELRILAVGWRGFELDIERFLRAVHIKRQRFVVLVEKLLVPAFLIVHNYVISNQMNYIPEEFCHLQAQLYSSIVSVDLFECCSFLTRFQLQLSFISLLWFHRRFMALIQNFTWFRWPYTSSEQSAFIPMHKNAVK